MDTTTVTTEFVKTQGQAWCTIVTEMLEKPLFCAINGSVNGPGSSLRYTKDLRRALPKLLKSHNITTMLDAPCGDLTWVKQTQLDFLHSYIGMDVDPRIINTNKLEMKEWTQFIFVCANLLTKKRLPEVDVILCRDFLAHLTTEYISLMIDKFKASGSTYLLASNYPGVDNNYIYDPSDYPAHWLGYLERQHDLTTEPFNLTRIDGIPETSPPGGVLANKHELALFRL